MTYEPERRAAAAIKPTVEGMGFRLVRVRLFGHGQRTLQVMAERPETGAMAVDDCTELSRALSAVLDVEDPIEGAYTLEVSSPGMDRPLVEEQDFARFVGREIKLETARPIDGRRRFRGRLEGIAQGMVALDTAEGRQAVPFADIRDAKLVVTEAQLAEALKGRKPQPSAGKNKD
ncbi:MAG: ribosome maturation factor RimP [Alphaproteobacteria bacterium]|nr:ribosome maturation factor RimP [Alphaproteobacteria bacterium]